MDARRAALVLAAAAVAGLAAACSGQPLTGVSAAAHSCAEYRAPEAACPPSLTYKTAKPILERSCVPCHWSEDDPEAPWPLTKYSDVASWDDVIKTNLLTCAQPPANSPFPFSAEDRGTLLDWLQCKHPQ